MNFNFPLFSLFKKYINSIINFICKWSFSCVLIFVFILSVTFSFAQQNVSLDTKKSLSQYIFRTWTTEEGLPSNAILDIIQDQKGYIWIATHDGLARFDGAKFTSYTVRNTPIIRSHAIRSLLADRNGAVWIGTQRGILKYENNQLTIPMEFSVLNEYSIEIIYEDATGVVWVGTSSNGVFFYQDGQFRPLKELRLHLQGAVRSIFEKDNALYFASQRGDIARYENNKINRIVDFEQTRGILFGKTINKRTWIGTDNGLKFLQGDSLISPPYPKINAIKDAFDILEDQNGFLWIASENGLYRYNRTTKVLENYNETQGLASNILQKLVVDIEGNIWIGMFRGGLAQILDGKFVNISPSEGLCSNIIYSILQFTPEKYLIAGESDSISIVYGNTVRNARLPLQLPSQRIRHMLFDADSSLWISTYSGLVKITRENKHKIYEPKHGLLDDHVRLTFQTKDSTIWAGTRRAGLFYLTKEDSFKHVNDNLASETVMSMAEDKKGNFIVGTKRGVSFIENKQIIKQLWTQNGLASNIIFSIFVDTNNVIWLGTDAGLTRIEGDKITNFDASSGLCEGTVFDILEDKEGYFWLPCNNGIMRITTQQLNDFANGKRPFVDCRFFNRTDGVKSDQMVGTGKGLVDSKGNIWFPTYKGVAYINPKTITRKENDSKAIFEKLETDKKNIYDFDKDIYLAAGTQYLSIFFTAFDYQNSFSLDFKYRLVPFDKEWIDSQNQRNATYTNLPPNEYRFEVITRKGDGSWNEENPSILNFTVRPHWYQRLIFQVAAVLGVILFFLLIYYLRNLQYKRNQIYLEKEVSSRTEEVLKQKSQLQVQKEELQNTVHTLNQTQIHLVQSEKMASLGQLTAGIAHEINNPINFVYAGVDALQTTLDELMELMNLYEELEELEKNNANEEQKKEKFNEIIELKSQIEFEELKQDLNQLVKDIRYGAHRTSEIVKGLRTFSRLDEVELRWADLHENIVATLVILRPQYKDNIEIIRNFDKNISQIECFPGKLNQVFTNIIANAIQAIDEKSKNNKIIISTQKLSKEESPLNIQTVKISIQDSGKGMKEEIRQKIFEPFFTTKEVGKGTGLGLSISFGLIEKHQGKMEVESIIGEGTTFLIYLPIDRNEILST
ncbi:histidine kinase,Y_Y_Y domain-containing protein,histidine kinase,putative transcriptional regulator [Bernardetia litoralis DSM 6794]|uniref:histidine kinase n=1 Tax=Bernardetia litoralis (strain ATCC 23117 / DSM 6794 / NBRC 15988 / NCIMB 1366 / Fx l1 / Sio-4) TaxID=880071 RepID=I4AIP1_BERLS|nr:two-component regulator propeller domain-containing protein [Bernardetia litoralis]AFM03826.1 histidine kinase,Y_Y_Y domain-containing protein,histidine kinase,putative transcriptional regulator [Bernardetia litoralis DSM 6794]